MGKDFNRGFSIFFICIVFRLIFQNYNFFCIYGSEKEDKRCSGVGDGWKILYERVTFRSVLSNDCIEN